MLMRQYPLDSNNDNWDFISSPTKGYKQRVGNREITIMELVDGWRNLSTRNGLVQWKQIEVFTSTRRKES